MSVCAAVRLAAPATAAAASRNSGSSGCSTSSPALLPSLPSMMMKSSPRISLPSHRRCLVVSRAKKAEKGGFGKADSSKQAAPVKVRSELRSERARSAVPDGKTGRKKLTLSLSHSSFLFFISTSNS